MASGGDRTTAIKERASDQAFSDLMRSCRELRNDDFGLLYPEEEVGLKRHGPLNQVAFRGNDYGIAGSHFDREKWNLDRMPLRTHDLAQAWLTHNELQPGDVLLGDRGFCSYAHLARLMQAGSHGVFRLHQKMLMDFRIGRMHAPPRPFPKLKRATGLPRSRWVKWLGHCDQLVEYFKPAEVPNWMTPEAYAALPSSIIVREVRYSVTRRGFRRRQITLVTTLLDPVQYPADELAKLYFDRWRIELHLRHLKQTLHMDVLRCKTVAGVHKEVRMLALVYHLVRLLMLPGTRRQHVNVERTRFLDAVRWLVHVHPGEPPRGLMVHPPRRGRVEPRIRKRRPKPYAL